VLTLIGNELDKLRTVRSTWMLLIIQQAVIVAGISGLGLDVDPGADHAARRLVAHAGLASAILTLVLGITAVAGEYRHKSITETYLATPRRSRVILAKLVAYGLAGALLGAISAGTGLITAGAWLAGKGGSLELADPDVWRTAVGIIAYNALFAAIGVSVGALIRNLTGAVAAALSWIALFETTVGNLFKDVGRWLPYSSGMALDYIPTKGDALSQWSAAGVLATYAVVLAAVAIVTTVRRDVT
jgi:ABC-2 type transport system permease protein